MPLTREEFEEIKKELIIDSFIIKEFDLPVISLGMVELILSHHEEMDVKTVRIDPNASTGRNSRYIVGNPISSEDLDRMAKGEIVQIVSPNAITGRNPKFVVGNQDSLFTVDNYQQLVNAKIKAIIGQQEEIITAFIAKYGCQPDEIEQIEVEHPNGGRTWYVRKRAKTALTVERVKSIIDQKLRKNVKEGLPYAGGVNNDEYLKHLGKEVALLELLKEINEAENDTRTED